jgi:formylglycine-generating enzyme required for sulfatase activity
MKIALPFAFLMILSPTFAHAVPLDMFRDCDACPEMIELPLGTFIMGAPEDEFRNRMVIVDGKFRQEDAENPMTKTDEGPQHSVAIDIPFAMGRDEVTYDQWMACVDDGGCGGYVPKNTIGRARAGFGVITMGGSHPVIFVSYADIQSYLAWLNEKTGTNSYRLPTEAEWEYAARAGTTTRFAQGENITTDQVNFSGEVSEWVLFEKLPHLFTEGAPVAVERLDAANAWGLRHMSGNVNELTRSCYSEAYAGWHLSSVWLAESQTDQCVRVQRGGGYALSMDSFRGAWRVREQQFERSEYTGFRILRELN